MTLLLFPLLERSCNLFILITPWFTTPCTHVSHIALRSYLYVIVFPRCCRWLSRTNKSPTAFKQILTYPRPILIPSFIADRSARILTPHITPYIWDLVSRCRSCIKTGRPQRYRKVSLSRVPDSFNDHVKMDFLFISDLTEHHIIDFANF